MGQVVVTPWLEYLYGCSEGIARTWLSPQPFLPRQFSTTYRETRRIAFARRIRQHFVGELTHYLPLFRILLLLWVFFSLLELNVLAPQSGSLVHSGTPI